MDRTTSLHHHLRYNHFPAVHEDWVTVCERAINRAQRALDAGEPITGKVRRPKSHGGGLVPIWDVIDVLHLDGYLDYGLEDESWRTSHVTWTTDWRTSHEDHHDPLAGS